MAGMVTADDMRELPPCSCIPVGDARITNSCLLHDPFFGLLVEPPVQFTGLLSVLGGEGDATHER